VASILVTGGAGFIGSHVADRFLAAGNRVTIVDNLSSGKRDNIPRGAEFHELDIGSPQAAELVRDGGFDMVAHLATMAEYWLKDMSHAKGLRDIRRSLGSPAAVFDKDATLLSLREIERVGRSIYPLNEERLKSSPYARALANYLKDPVQFPLHGGWQRTTFTKTAWKAQMSLIIRLLVRLPLRQPNIREMKLGHNLKRTTDGHWEIHFRGRELKVAMRQGRENEVRYLFPEDLCSLLLFLRSGCVDVH
jgi:hypothetical protein